MLRVVWINKSNWKKPGPIVYMGLLNALAFAQHNIATDYFVGYGDESDTEQDLTEFYGLDSSPFLNIVRIKESASGKRDVYKQAVLKINDYLSHGVKVIALTRELGALSKLLKIKKTNASLQVVYESHDYYLNRAHLPKQGFSALRRQWAERLLIRKADALICLTEHQRALYQQQLTQLPVLAAPLGCLNFPRQDAEARRVKRNIAYVGHLHEYKGSHLIFDIAKLLKSKNIRLICYGGHQPQVESLRLKAQQQGLKDVLMFESFVSPADLHQILENDISIGLVPLQDTFYSRYLTCPVKALDFLSHGIPIVASDLPSTREVLHDVGHYCLSSDAVQFAQAVETLLDNSLSYQTENKNSYQRNTQLQWHKRAEKILQLVS